MGIRTRMSESFPGHSGVPGHRGGSAPRAGIDTKGSAVRKDVADYARSIRKTLHIGGEKAPRSERHDDDAYEHERPEEMI